MGNLKLLFSEFGVVVSERGVNKFACLQKSVILQIDLSPCAFR